MFKDAVKGFLFTIGAFVAINVIGFFDKTTKVSFGKKADKDCEEE